jgi:very-short-patch-repair endonuclease
LKERGIYNELEPFDGYKHVDIHIPWAKLNLEIDGRYHLTDPEHLFRDLERDSYSHLDGIDTIRIPNFYVESHLDEIANAIADVARKRQECGIPPKQTRKIRY